MKLKYLPKLLGVISIAAITGFSAPTVIAHEGYTSHHHLVTRNSPDSDWHYEKSHKRKKHGVKHRHDRGHRDRHHKHQHAKKYRGYGHRHRHVPGYADHYRDGIIIKLYKHF